jgi:hypothetical protein
VSRAPFSLEDLRRWSAFGGDWRVLDARPDRVTLELCACTGETMERVESDDPELLAEAAAREASQGQGLAGDV